MSVRVWSAGTVFRGGTERRGVTALCAANQRLSCRQRCSETRCQTTPLKNWWSLSGSNRPPRACKARALPDELKPQKLAYYAVSSDRNFQNLRAFKILALRDRTQFHVACVVLDVNRLLRVVRQTITIHQPTEANQ